MRIDHLQQTLDIPLQVDRAGRIGKGVGLLDGSGMYSVVVAHEQHRGLIQVVRIEWLGATDPGGVPEESGDRPISRCPRLVRDLDARLQGAGFRQRRLRHAGSSGGEFLRRSPVTGTFVRVAALHVPALDRWGNPAACVGGMQVALASRQQPDPDARQLAARDATCSLDQLFAQAQAEWQRLHAQPERDTPGRVEKPPSGELDPPDATPSAVGMPPCQAGTTGHAPPVEPRRR